MLRLRHSGIVFPGRGEPFVVADHIRIKSAAEGAAKICELGDNFKACLMNQILLPEAGYLFQSHLLFVKGDKK